MKAGRTVVVATAGTLQQADMMRLALQADEIDAFIVDESVANTLWHLSPVLHPKGIRIAVGEADAERAREVLDSLPPLRVVPEESNPADRYGRKAAVAGVFALIVTPLSLLVVYYIVQALRALSVSRPMRPRAFRQNLLVAAILGILVPAIVLLSVIPQIW